MMKTLTIEGIGEIQFTEPPKRYYWAGYCKTIDSFIKKNFSICQIFEKPALVCDPANAIAACEFLYDYVLRDERIEIAKGISSPSVCLLGNSGDGGYYLKRGAFEVADGFWINDEPTEYYDPFCIENADKLGLIDAFVSNKLVYRIWNGEELTQKIYSNSDEMYSKDYFIIPNYQELIERGVPEKTKNDIYALVNSFAYDMMHEALYEAGTYDQLVVAPFYKKIKSFGWVELFDEDDKEEIARIEEESLEQVAEEENVISEELPLETIEVVKAEDILSSVDFEDQSKSKKFKDLSTIATYLVDNGRNTCVDIVRCLKKMNEATHIHSIGALIKTVLRFSFDVGLAAYDYYQNDPTKIMQTGVFDTLSDPRSVDCMDEYSIDYIGIGWTSKENKTLTEITGEISIKILSKSNYFSPCNFSDAQLIESATAAYYLGLLFERARIEGSFVLESDADRLVKTGDDLVKIVSGCFNSYNWTKLKHYLDDNCEYLSRGNVRAKGKSNVMRLMSGIADANFSSRIKCSSFVDFVNNSENSLVKRGDACALLKQGDDEFDGFMTVKTNEEGLINQLIYLDDRSVSFVSTNW